MTSFTLQDNETFVTFDFTSLFTKTPIPEALEVIRHRLRKDKTLSRRTKLTAENIMELMSVIANSTHFKFQEKVFQKKYGTSMRTPVSPLIANFYMEDLERKAISRHTTTPLEPIC